MRRRDSRRIAAAISFGILAAATSGPSAAQSVTRQVYVDQQTVFMRTTTDAAVRACLSQETTTETVSLRAQFDHLVSGVQSALGLQKKVEAIRGASREMPHALQRIENDTIRNCMKIYMQPALAAAAERYQAGDTGSVWPQPVDLRLRLLRTTSLDRRKFTDALYVNLRPPRRSPLDLRLVPQDPRGLAYYQYGVPYPAASDVVRGTIVAETREDARLSSAPPTLTQICLQRPPRFPQQRADYDIFDCTEGGACKPSRDTTGWLQACPTAHAKAAPAPMTPRLWRVAWQDEPDRPTTGPSGVRWVAPSLRSLAGRPHEGVGYTVFTVETDAFERDDVVGVEVGVRVNGTPVEEEGLPPELRPSPNDPTEAFSHSFALQTLNFTGAEGGCDVVELSLRPLLTNGEKGAARTARLSYVALRDVAERRQPLGAGQLTWLASYITPAREWRNIAEVHSYIYSTRAGAGAAQRAAGLAAADKRWIDAANLTYQGQRVVGVVRPPRTIQSDGSAAFGLGAGLVQPNGQVRFTFSDPDARKLAAFMIAQRTSAEARRVIAPAPYIFQAVGGSRTAPGICEAAT